MSFFGNNELDSKQREGLLGMASILSGMSTNPNVALQGMASQGIKGIQAKRKSDTALALAGKQANATAAYLRNNGRGDLATAVEDKAITASQALAMFKPKDQSAAIQSYQFYADQFTKSNPNDTPKSFEQYQTDLKAAGVAQPDVGETSWQKAAGPAQVNLFVSNIERADMARKTINNVSSLEVLGDAMDSGIVPPFARGMILEGMSGPIDAYKAMLNTTALSLKGKGTGPMTDQDFLVLQTTAGSISANPEARRIVQQALTDNSRISLQIADISSRAISNDINRLEATRQINKLMQSSPLTDEMKARLNVLTSGGSAAGSGGGVGGKTIKQINAELLALQKQRDALAN
tara:strand:+ start:27 stop:1073 length:1047 start_codon:yes stop_codon:yes gene_type:complete